MFDDELEDEKKTYKLRNLVIKEISTVKNPAVQSARVIVMKSSDKDNSKIEIQTENTIIHKRLEKGQIFQYALIPDQPDGQGDIIDESEIEKVTELTKERIFKGDLKIGKEHNDFKDDRVKYLWTEYDPTGLIAKSYNFPKDKVVKGGMIVGIQLTDIGIEEFKKGDFVGISIGGEANREELKKSNDNMSIKNIFKSFLIELKDIVMNKEDRMSENVNKNNNTTNEVVDILNTTIKESIKEILSEINKSDEKPKTEEKNTDDNSSNEITKSIEDLKIQVDNITKSQVEKEKEQNEKDSKIQETLKSLVDITKQLNDKLNETSELTNKVAEVKGISKTQNAKPTGEPDIEKVLSGNIWDSE
jgi:hypothetical protein